jgi:hypothetical protein
MLLLFLVRVGVEEPWPGTGEEGTVRKKKEEGRKRRKKEREGR